MSKKQSGSQVIVVTSGKGGVGKTTTTASLGSALALRGKRLGFPLSEIRELINMYDKPKDTAPQLVLYLQVLAKHRQMLEQQRKDIADTLAEIQAQEAKCSDLLKQLDK